MTPAVYFIIEVDIHDAEGMKPYQAQVDASFRAFGGVRLVAGGAPEVLEGKGPKGKIVIVRFPDMAAAHAWHDSPQYQAILPHRLAAANSRAYFVQGITA